MLQFASTSATDLENRSVLPDLSLKADDISPELQTILQHIVDDVVQYLGCVGAMVATLEADNTMPVRAYSIDLAPVLLRQLESKLLGTTIIGPKSVSFLDDPKYQENLSVRAVKGDPDAPKIVTSDRLHDLFRPVVNHYLSNFAQKLSGIKQVIAVPFFLDDEVVGNLFAASRRPFSEADINFLKAFGKQAGIAIQSQRHLTQTQALERITLALQAKMDNETQILEMIADAVVNNLGYAGAMVATVESDGELLMQAFTHDLPPDLLTQLKSKLGEGVFKPPLMARLDDPHVADNICVQAVTNTNHAYLTSDSLHDLFLPRLNRMMSNLVQQTTRIKQIVAVPFYLNDTVVGNLCVVTRRNHFPSWELDLLVAFGQQAAVGLRNARLYRRAEDQRQIAQVVAKMAFSAATNVHALRNHIGSFRTFLSVIKIFPHLDAEQQAELLESAGNIMHNLNESAEILDSLHEPWRKSPDVPTPVNDCIFDAIRKSFPRESLDLTLQDIPTQDRVILHKNLTPHLPLIKVSPDMLAEAFRIVIKNAAEAIAEHRDQGDLWITNRLNEQDAIEVSIQDNGIGIPPENLSKIFEMRWTTKQGRGMGFGLFWTKDYIEGLGGTLRVESMVGQGTTFTFTLPTSS